MELWQSITTTTYASSGVMGSGALTIYSYRLRLEWGHWYCSFDNLYLLPMS